MFVKPREGACVVDPVTYRELPPEGGDVPETSYWIRRLRCGDVVETARPKAMKTVEKTVGAE